MSVNGDPPGKRSRRLSPEELAGEVARRLKLDRGGHRRPRRLDVVVVSRIVMGVAVVLLGIGLVFAVSWVGRLLGVEVTGTVSQETPVFGCPGEVALGVLFTGETVQLVGRTDDGGWFVVRDERGPGDLVFADAAAIEAGDDQGRLRARSCDPRRPDEVAAAEVTATTAIGTSSTTGTSLAPTTTLPGITTTIVTGPTSGRPPRRPTSSPGTTTTTTTTTTANPGTPTTPTTTPRTTTTRPGTPTTSTPTTSTTTTTTTQPTTTTSLTTTTTTATTTTTTTTTSTTTTTVSTTTTTEATTSSTITTTPP
jgi:hypothetical protein